MRKFAALSLAFALITLSLQFTSPKTFGKTEKFFQSENAIEGRYIVVLESESKDSFQSDLNTESAAYSLAGNYNGVVADVYSTALKGFSVEMSPEDSIALSKDPAVKFVEEDAEVSVSDAESTPSWALDRIDQRQLPLNSTYMYSQTGSGVHAYIMDTGIRVTHADFGGRASVAFDAINDGRNGNDCHGHGTHVAGIVGSSTYGVAKSVSLHAVRVLPCSGFGVTSQLIAGVDWVTANRINPAVVNISIGLSGISGAYNTAISNSIASGVTYVVAAGNNAMDACNFSPSAVPAAITVGATGDLDQKAGYSNFGACVDIFAPGSSILSLSNGSDTGTRYMSGTSMASPIVAGVAAIYLKSNPSATPTAVAMNLKNAATPNMIAGLDPVSPNKLIYSLIAPLAPTSANASISGSVVWGNSGIRGATVRATNAATGVTKTVTTGSFGSFRFDELPVGQLYTLTVSAKKYSFPNSTTSLVLNENVSDVTFYAVR